MKTAGKYIFFLTLVYLGVAHATAGGTLIKAAGSEANSFEKTLQGR